MTHYLQFFLRSSLFLLLPFTITTAQTTFSEVLTIFDQNGCSGSYCHSSGSGGLTLDPNDPSGTYASLIGVTPQNMTAMEKGDELVKPGYPERSFLYRKINGALYEDAMLESGEGDMMPQIGATMSDRDKEFIRQWIYYGAPQNGKAFTDDTKDAFTDYHTNGGIGPIDKPEPPAEGEGFQLHFGSIFLPPGGEVEYLKKHEINLPEELEINRIELFMNDFSHHFILYKYNQAIASNKPEGIRPVTLNTDNPLINSNTQLVTAWQDNQDFRLPEGTAYKWNEETVLELNYHLLNYSTSSPLAGDMYLNIYTQPAGTADKEMLSDILLNLLLFIPNDGEDKVFANSFGPNDFAGVPSNTPINIWNMTSHTHKYGKDYDMYLNGGEINGLELFEGQYNTDYTQFTGVYDYAHPPIRFFDNLIEFMPNQSITQTAVYNNNGPTNVNFGLTTDDEMMLSMIQYTIGDNHQADMQLNDIQATYCLNDGPVELVSNYTSGVIGNGVVHNIFNPAEAGVGSHVLYADCCDPDKMFDIIIEVVPAIEEDEIVTVGNALIISDNEDHTYEWTFDGEIIEGANVNSYAAEFNGVYTVTVDNGTCSATYEKTVTEATNVGVEELLINNLTIAPNPFNQDTKVSFSLKETTDVTVVVYDLTGKKIWAQPTTQLTAGNQVIALSELANIQTGVYILQIEMGTESISKRLIKN